MLTSGDFLSNLANNHHIHSRDNDFFADLESKIATEISSLHSEDSGDHIAIGELGTLIFPYLKMGSIDSSKLFGLDELILFSYYFVNRNRYKRTLDLGANIGLHTLVMKKLGFCVTSYEPDLIHLSQIKLVMELNNLTDQGLMPRAISDRNGEMEYLRVLGNTTGSHLLGSKENVHGPTEIVTVEVDDIFGVLANGNFDFVKMDVEGHEAVLLNRITPELISKTDIMLEIGSSRNAELIFESLSLKKIPSYAQKINWKQTKKLEDFPSHHRHGSLFLSMQGAPNWS
jgi:FkbM family methyltransferase